MRQPKNRQYALEVNGIKFTQKEVDYLREYCTNGVPKNVGSTVSQLIIKISRAKPEWKMPTRMMFFRFAYGEGIVKL